MVVIWGGFLLFVLGILAFDLGVFSRESKAISAKAALARTAIYFLLAVGFTVLVYFGYEQHWFGLGVYAAADGDPAAAAAHAKSHLHVEGTEILPQSGLEAAIQFFMGYILEQSLSVDNIFVIALILAYFQVPPASQHRVLLWGIVGALVMRGVMIGVGVTLIHHFHWLTYVFGAFLIYTAFKMIGADEDDEIDMEHNAMVRLVRRFFHVHTQFAGDHFFATIDGKWGVTPLALALVIVETTDLIFAVDSIPAVIGLTQDYFLVFTSNVFAILGLRSLYFALADLLGKFRFLKFALVVILALVGIKMLAQDFLPRERQLETTFFSLAVISLALGAGVFASLVIPEKESHTEQPASEGSAPNGAVAPAPGSAADAGTPAREV